MKSQTTIYIGDCRDVLKTLPDESVHCVVTSPPYFNLRDYGTAEWEGGDTKCDHKSSQRPDGGQRANRTTPPGRRPAFRETCGKCGARRIDSQIGLESDYKQYVDELVDVFREVKRVLRANGTVWLNLGDSYNAAGRTTHGTREGAKQGTHRASTARVDKPRPNAFNLKSKDLVGIPWRVAFALQEDGWYLRQDIIWSKPNAMPESVTDRCTKSHEYIFLLSKSPKYYFDADAITERALNPIGELVKSGTPHKQEALGRDTSKSSLGSNYGPQTRNKRSVWNISTKPYHDAHFATFPPDLIQPCILAGCPMGGMVMDPFGGTGTVAMVANNSGRDATLIELNPKSVEMARKRIVTGFLVAKPIIVGAK